MRFCNATFKTGTNVGAGDSHRTGNLHCVCVTGETEPKEIAARLVVQEFRRQPQFGIELSEVGATVEQQFVTRDNYPKLPEDRPCERNNFRAARDRRDVRAAFASAWSEQFPDRQIERQDFQKTQHTERCVFIVEFYFI